MLYVADLRRNGLLKVGVTQWFRLDIRRAELRQKLSAPKLEYAITTLVPFGWGSDVEWERHLIAALRQDCGQLQLFSEAEESEEVVDATIDDARRELSVLRRPSEVPIHSRALDLASDKEDWRFARFMDFFYPEAHYSTHGYSLSHWADPLTRLCFLYWLRHEPITRAIRECEGLCCDEIDEIIAVNQGTH